MHIYAVLYLHICDIYLHIKMIEFIFCSHDNISVFLSKYVLISAQMSETPLYVFLFCVCSKYFKDL